MQAADDITLSNMTLFNSPRQGWTQVWASSVKHGKTYVHAPARPNDSHSDALG